MYLVMFMSNNLKIISGKYRGLSLTGDTIEGTRPTMNRVKESVFAMIQGQLRNSICLDLFAGSGSLGLEALSNGAQKCYFVDNNKIVINTIRNNMQKLHITEECLVIQQDYKTALLDFKKQGLQFDIIFLDPPYKFHLVNDCLNKIKEYNLLNDDGIIVCEYESEIIDNVAFQVLKKRVYGSKKVMILGK